MNQIIVECPGCLSKLRLRESEHDVQLDCPRCGERILIEGSGAGRASGPSASRSAGSPRQPEPRRSTTDASKTPPRNERPASSRAAVGSSGSSPKGADPGSSGSSGRRRSPGRTRGAKDDFDEFDATYETEAARPPSRRARRSLSNNNQTSQSSGVLIGLAIAGAVIGLGGAGWYFFGASGSGEAVVENEGKNEGPSSLGSAPIAGEASPGSSASGNIPAEVKPNTFAAGNMPSVVPPGQNSVPQPSPFNSPPNSSGGSFGGSVASAPGSRPAAINPPPQSTNPGGFQTPPAAAVPGSGAAVASATDGRRLRYQWTNGTEHLYVVNITAGEGDGTYRVNGTCNYRVGGNSATPDEESSGTGFAISADGYIGTCAHVVDGARQIEVVINNQTLTATVVAVNTKADVAILKINASGLTAVQFQDSDTVQLAESVRVIGFPLSDVLGTDVKITSGTVAGIVMDPQRGKRIQVDAPINPGNSGGPVVNDAGEVVGVASAKLAGSSVTAVGFAAPVNELRNLMTAQRIPVNMATRGIALSGPAVFQKVRPSVCYIKVRGSSGGATATISYSGSFTETKSINPGGMRFGAFPMMPSHTSDQGTMRVNSMGEILQYSGKEHLPFVLGYMGMFFIERLDPYSETQWSHEENSTLQRIKRSSRGPGGLGGPGGRGFMPPRMPMGPRGFGGGPFGQSQPEEVVDTIPAVERVSYRTGPELNGKLSLQKTYEFITTRNPQQPYMKIRGTGTVVFDLNQGLPQSLEYNATLESNDEDGHSSFPLKVTYTLRDPEEVKREREQAIQRSKDAAEQRRQQATVPDNQLVQSLLDQVRQAEGDTRASQPLSKLAEIAVVDDMRSQVLIVARKHMKNSNGFVSKSAAEAFAHWATDKEFDELIAIIKNKDGMMYSAHKKVVATMATFKDPRIYPILIEAMHHAFVRSDAKNALISVGPNAEDTVLEQFDQITDSSVKRELLEVLQKIGTSKCERFLEKIATGPDFSLRHNAQRALDAVRAR